jgi:phenylalanyl-tRNA synthetase beta chain
MNNSLTSATKSTVNPGNSGQKEVGIFNPLSNDLNRLRTSLLSGALEVVAYNQNRKEFNLKMYEYGRVYSVLSVDKSLPVTERFREVEKLALLITGDLYPENWKYQSRPGDIYDLKAYMHNVLERLGLAAENIEFREVSSNELADCLTIHFGKQELGVLGKASAELLENHDIKQAVYFAELDLDNLILSISGKDVKYSEISKFPAVRRDLALLVAKEVKFEDIKKVAFKYEKVLLKRVNLFDIYEGENIDKGKKSYAVSFYLQDTSRTLTDKIIDNTMAKLVKGFEKEIGASIRG